MLSRLSWLAGACFTLGCASAQAATLSLIPVNQNVVLGNTVSLQLMMDFSDDATIGGGVDVFYDDSVLQFVSFVFDAGLGDDPAFRRQPDALSGELNGLGFGEFGGLSGPSLVGTFTFNTLTSGSASFSLGVNDYPVGAFYSATTYELQLVDFQGAAIEVSAVPVPAAAWLLFSGLVMVGAVSRRD